MKALDKVATQLIALLALLLAWEAATHLFQISPDKLPSLSSVLSTAWSGRVALADAVWTTVLEALLGLVAGIAFGIASGIAFSSFRLLERMLLPYFIASQAVPIIAFGAIIIIWFGNGIVSKAVIAFYLSFFPVAVNTLGGIRRVSPDEIGLLRTFGASRLTILWKLLLPTALPPIFTAIRIGVGLALVGAIVGEWFGASRGLGVVLLTAMFDNQVQQLWAAILLTGLTGTVLFWVVVGLQKKIAWWQTEV
ncbi:ABC transporter permease [Bradyrhizobium sp. NP1]|uniref:ABC transporter permease n=1 Tax=Bradyrhizobium sp. NP1 TaxID=3049772 RepID=UPI0025A5470F|nr:ABC transporter permease [Bradyrhizobium sp. NP1]WJR76654.1 ABC transporter permease [Bradyrhizobium sp. NP1]